MFHLLQVNLMTVKILMTNLMITWMMKMNLFYIVSSAFYSFLLTLYLSIFCDLLQWKLYFFRHIPKMVDRYREKACWSRPHPCKSWRTKGKYSSKEFWGCPRAGRGSEETSRFCSHTGGGSLQNSWSIQCTEANYTHLKLIWLLILKKQLIHCGSSAGCRKWVSETDCDFSLQNYMSKR